MRRAVVLATGLATGLALVAVQGCARNAAERRTAPVLAPSPVADGGGPAPAPPEGADDEAGTTSPAAAAATAPRAEERTRPTVGTMDQRTDWLSAQQRTDGSWPGASAARFSDEAATGLVLLCYLGAGETHSSGQYKDVVKSGLGYLIAQQAADGWFVAAGAPHRVHDQALATLALTEAYGLTGSRLFRDPASRAVAALAGSRGTPEWSDPDALGWMALAFKSAHMADLSSPDLCSAVAAAFDALPGPHGPRVTAQAALARIFTGADPARDPALRRAIDELMAHLPAWSDTDPDTMDFPAWYFGQLACFQAGGRQWRTWSDAFKSAVIDNQRTDGELAGSWDPADPWSRARGRVAGTALMILAMEVYYRYGRVFGAAGGGAPPAMLPPSTGGTAEPNGNPYGDTFFRDHGVNPFVDTEDDRFSTFGLDVDTASYAVARRFVADGNVPEPASVRVEEFVNAFPSDDPPPTDGTFRLAAEGMRAPFGGERYHLVRLGLRAKDVRPTERLAARLTLVVDVSGSMAAENRLGLVQRALRLLVENLRDDDQVALVKFGSSSSLVTAHTGDRERLLRAIDDLHPGGSTNAAEGLRIAFEQADAAFLEGGINRVVLCSDGVANTGLTGAADILSSVDERARRGIALSTVGFGMGNFNDVLMEELADHGDGTYAYVDRIEEARRVFVQELTGTLQTVAKDAKVQVEWNPDVVARYRLLGYENRDVRDDRFRDDTVDGGEVGAGQTVTALYELKLRRDAADAPLGTFRVRYAVPQEDGRVVEESIPLRRAILAGAPSRHLRLTAAVAELAELLRGSYWAREGSYAAVRALLDEIAPLYPRRADVEELREMVAKIDALVGRRPAVAATDDDFEDR